MAFEASDSKTSGRSSGRVCSAWKIPVRKAIGARRRTILLQFLIEAAALCLIGVGASVGLLALTAGHGYNAAWSAMEQGCDQKWVVRAGDLEPGPPPLSKAFEWETHRFDWEPK